MLTFFEPRRLGDEYDCFPGFAWAAIRAFRDALASCAFGRGDILYETVTAYRPWPTPYSYAGRSIQVTAASSTTTSSGTASTFRKQWSTSVTCDIRQHDRDTPPERIETTQGRIYTALRTGNLSILATTTPEPQPPLMWSEVNRPAKKDAPLDGLLEQIAVEILSNDNGHSFLIALDPLFELACRKYRAIHHHLILKFPLRVRAVAPADTNLAVRYDFSPTMTFVIFAIDGQRKDIEAALKTALYSADIHANPSKQKFKLRAHGLLHTGSQSKHDR